MGGIRKQWDDLSTVGQSEFPGGHSQLSLVWTDPTSVHTRPRQVPKGTETWPTEPRLLAGNYVWIMSEIWLSWCPRLSAAVRCTGIINGWPYAFPLWKDDSPSSLTEHGSGRHRREQNQFSSRRPKKSHICR
jgi:hypothetical protein